MSNLSLAKKFHKDSGRSAGRTLEKQFDDLRKAVERIIVHLEKSEEENSASPEPLAGPSLLLETRPRAPMPLITPSKAYRPPRLRLNAGFPNSPSSAGASQPRATAV